ncbi:Inosine/uridine-preferring nucleoside hydrolase domain-containing protein [Massariosphaeria phaeospora]|uniref:Inosine/uridine-preferring nucleoside hydrolase domain-containing protein n=1 Tax=Massariosphaeria phaeospora TaxID=100035 RepID=A0A7C8M664_9PLEO|nr:Inosine/uridine-preferring nucleoside hydrolase domain-containing protein [Massariosphaeria phaeospora]
MAPNRIIIDTDPGVDDVLAMLLAFSATRDEVEVVMLSLTFGNVKVQDCLRNVVTLFQYIEKERAWRRDHGRPEGFEALLARKPIVAVGAEEPLAEQMMVADCFHGIDGLGGIYHSHPHLTPAETWKSLFAPTPNNVTPEVTAELQKVKDEHSLFTPSLKPAHEEMLQILRDNDPDTITIVAIGPLTNLAIAAATDPEAFLRVKEVVVMGGAIDAPGNMGLQPPNLALINSPSVTCIAVPNFNLIKQPDTPLRRMLNERNQITPGAEFNTYADSIASARVFALTSPNPRTTMPPVLSGKGQLPAYPEKLSRQLKLKLFPLDITSPHLLPHSLFTTHTTSPALSTSPLAFWTTLFLTATYAKILSLSPPNTDPETLGLELHDPLPIWYCLTSTFSSAPETARWEFTAGEDIRVETAGQWTRGCCIVDRRGREVKLRTGDVDADVVGDAGGWGDERRRNRVERCVGSPWIEGFAGELLGRVFGEV